jgi:hypothetical protein
MSKSARKTQGVSDFGTSPHGLSVDLARTNQKTRKAENLHYLADGFEFRGCEAGSDAKRPDVCAPWRTPSAASKRPQFHYLEMTDVEFLHLLAAMEHSRNRDRRTIRRGFAEPQDLRATDSIWQKLQEVQTLRQKGGRA